MTENKKTTPGVTSTESGSKGGHPAMDDSLAHNQSVTEKVMNVKAPQATARELADALYRLIRSMECARIGDAQIVSILLNTLRPEEGDAPAC